MYCIFDRLKLHAFSSLGAYNVSSIPVINFFSQYQSCLDFVLDLVCHCWLY